MFEFAISQHKRKPLTKSQIGSGVVSCLVHLGLVLLLVSFPGLLRPGSHLWFEFPTIYSPEPEDSKWKTIAIIQGSGPMLMPSAKTLDRIFSPAGSEPSKGSEIPIRVRWGDESKELTGVEIPLPTVQPALGTKDPQPSTKVAAAEDQGSSVGVEEPGSGAEQTGGSRSVRVLGIPLEAPPPIKLPTPSLSEAKEIPKKAAEVTAVPETISPTPESSSEPREKRVRSAGESEQSKVFKDKRSALRTEGSGLFDTKGFPLGEYANLIIERIKGNWMIPSNLRNSNGRTTLIFFIEKDGQYTNLDIVAPSGSNSLDLAAMSSIIGSNPFPPLPDGFPGDRVGAKFVFSYNEIH